MGDTQGRGDGSGHVHLCRVVDGRAAFVSAALEFLADGLARGLRVLYVAEGDAARLRADLAPLLRLPAARRPGAVEVRSAGGAYGAATGTLDVDAQVQVSADATAAALADGFAGFRAAADSTALAGTPGQLDAFARYEHRVDRLMTRVPFSGLCGFRRDALDDHTLAQLACLHPEGGAEHAPFRLHATTSARAALSGELDVSTVGLFATALDRAGLHDAGPDVVIDATTLRFADHRNLLLLERLGHEHDRAVVLRSDRRVLHRLVTALEMTRVRVERAA